MCLVLCASGNGESPCFTGVWRGSTGSNRLEKYFFLRPSHTPARHLARRCAVLADRGGAPHTPEPRTRDAGIAQRAIGESVVAAKLEGCAFSSRRRHSRHPAPGGVAPSPTSRKRPSGDTKNLASLTSMHEKPSDLSRTLNKQHGDVDRSLRTILEHSIATQGKSMKAFGRHSNAQSQHMGNKETLPQRGRGGAARGDAVFKLYSDLIAGFYTRCTFYTDSKKAHGPLARFFGASRSGDIQGETRC